MNGLDSRLLEDRKTEWTRAISAKWSSSVGALELELLADVTSTSGGQEFSLQYGYPLDLGSTLITPNIGVTYLSKDMANYYYGTLEKEVARGVIDYKPDAVTIPHVGVNVMRFFGNNWTFLAFLEYSGAPGYTITISTPAATILIASPASDRAGAPIDLPIWSRASSMIDGCPAIDSSIPRLTLLGHPQFVSPIDACPIALHSLKDSGIRFRP